MENSALAPHSLGSVARHFAALPPPHSSLNRILLPSLLNVAECQYEKFESATWSTRRGFTGSLMSRRNPYPSHAPPASPIAGYTVMSWHCVGPRLANGFGRAAAAAAADALRASMKRWRSRR